MRTLLLCGLVAAPLCAQAQSFGDDLSFLREHQKVVVLKQGEAEVVVAPGYQGRVMTSTAKGDGGTSFGWVNRELIASGVVGPHMNAFGGEDRIWLGPEGGPYALFFPPGTQDQTLKDWQTPAVMDSLPWKTDSVAGTSATFSAHAELPNRKGATLSVDFSRTVRLLDRADAAAAFGITIPAGVDLVSFQTVNRISNAGKERWSAETGMPSIWILGMYTPSPRATIVIPLKDDSGAVRGDYFGQIGPDRLKADGRAVYLKADGQSRGKIGVSPAHATRFAGGWDAARGVLTLITYDLPADAAERPYVDSRWLDMPEPYRGDVLNAYNDGPPSPGAKPLGPFYEIESSSPAAALAPGESARHRHTTLHLQGPRDALDQIARQVLGVGLDTIEREFGAPAAEAFDGIDVNLHNIYRLSDARSRSISPENFTGAKGQGGRATQGRGAEAARDLGQGWKISPNVRIEPHHTVTLADIDGSGAIHHIWMTPTGTWRTTILRFYWDNEADPSIECPVGDFFGEGWGKYARLNSLPVAVNPGSGLNCYWPMPFRRHCRITLENLDDKAMGVYYQIDYTEGRVPADAAYFHAQFRRLNPLPAGSDYTLVDGISGRGQYVGTYLAIGPYNNGWWGEGEIKFFLDGDGRFPTICGTGTEDYFCGSYDFDTTTADANGVEHKAYTEFCSPYSGMPQVIRGDGHYQVMQRFGLYRWHLPDPIRFDHDLKVTIQSLGWKSGHRYLQQMADMASVAYWYQTEPHAKFPPLPARDQLEIN